MAEQNSILTLQSPTTKTLPKTVKITKTQNPLTEENLNLYSYTDYREYLKNYFLLKHHQNPNYSQSAFVRKAGMGSNSRGYLKLIIEGKRNLTPHTIRGFATALNLTSRDILYFENLVYFNQARTPKDREYYFERLMASAEGKETPQIELLKSQYDYYSNWYYPAIRELVALDHFKEDPNWICTELRSKITKQEASRAISVLLQMGLLKRLKNGKLAQSDPLIKYSGGMFSSKVQNTHIELMERAKESLLEDDYHERKVSCVTLSCDRARLSEINQVIEKIRDELTIRFGLGSVKMDSVIQINFQVFQLTPIRKKETSK